MQWKFTVQLIVFSDGFVSTSILAAAPIVALLDTEIVSIIDPSSQHLNQYAFSSPSLIKFSYGLAGCRFDVKTYFATQHSQGEELKLASPYYSAPSADPALPACTAETTTGCTRFPLSLLLLCV